MSKKLGDSTLPLKSLTGIVGILGAVSMLSLPAFSQNNTTPNRSSSPASAAGEVCIIPSRTMNADGSNVQSMSGSMGGSSRAGTGGNTGSSGSRAGTGGNTGSSGNTAGTSGNTGGSGNTAGTSGSMGGTSGGRTGTVGGTSGSGSRAGTSGNTGSSGNTAGTGGNADMSVTMMEGMIVCGTPTTPSGTNR